MRRIGIIIMMASLGLGVGFGGAACSKKAPAPATAPTATPVAQPAVANPAKAAQKAPGHLYYALPSEPEYLDPGLASGVVEINVILGLFEGLTTYDPKDLHPLPALAERWTISEDGLVYTMHLRPGAKWSDGHPVTAQDFVYAWERVLNPKTGSQYAFILYYLKNAKPYNEGTLTDAAQLGFQAVDPQTLQFTLEAPTPFMLTLLSHPTYYPVPASAVDQFGGRWTRPENIVTTGPFRLKSWTPYKSIVLEPNPQYWAADQVKLTGITFIPIEDQETGLKMYDAGEVDVLWYLPPRRFAELKTRPDFVLPPQLANYFFYVNTKRPPMDDVRVRRALAMTIDRETICNKYMQGIKLPLGNLVPPGVPGYTAAEPIRFDPEGARKLLAEAGYGEGKPLPEITINYNTQDEHKLVSQVIQQMWKQHLGITVKLYNEEWKTHLKTQQMKNFQLSRGGWVGDYVDPMTFLEIFTSKSPGNHTNWANPAYDALVTKANFERDAGKRFQILHEAETLIVNEVPMLPVYIYSHPYLMRSTVKGYYPNIQDLHPYRLVSVEP